MIVFVTPAADRWGIDEYLQQHGGSLAERMVILTYEEIVARRELPLGTYVFAGIDQLTPTETEIAAQCWKALSSASPEIRLINHPARALRRYQLLRACFERQRNAFRVRRATEWHRRQRFPVFVRAEGEHTGSLSPVLHNHRELVQALATSLVQGYRLRDLLIVEYCHTADDDGIFRLYSAAIVGETIVPKALVHNRNWITKWEGRLLDARLAGEQLAYLENHPHEHWLRETFALARIGYGLINYGVKDGVPQVWEINTNPTLVRRTGAPSVMAADQWALVAPAQARFIHQFQCALEQLDSAVDPDRRVRIAVSPSELRRLGREKRLRRRLRARRTAIAQLAAAPLWLARRLRRRPRPRPLA